MTIGWVPRYSPDGSRLTWERPGYWQAQFVNATTEIAHNGDVLLIGGLPTQIPAASELSAGGDVWAALRTDPVRVYTSTGQSILGAGCPVVNPLGQWGYVDDRQADVKNLIWQGAVVARGAITDVRASRTALVWSQAGRTWGLRLDQPDTAHDIQAAPVEYRPIPIDTPLGPWVLNHTATGLVLRPFGAADGYRFDNGGQAYYPDGVCVAGVIVAIFTNDRGEQAEHPFDLSRPRIPLGQAPAPALPIGPQGPARPADGTVYDLVPYVVGDPSTWPRLGPTHSVHQPIRGEEFDFVKFAATEPDLAHGESYETWAADANWILHREDASRDDPYSLEDQRLWPRRMAIGEARAFDVGHQVVWRRRADCQFVKREPMGRHMWLLGVWDVGYWGPDLGTRPTIALVYDNTAGIHAADRFIEVNYFAKGAGWVRWETHRSDLVYASGHATFTDATRAARSDFYLMGGPAPSAKLLGCAPPLVHYPPLSEDPPLKKCEVTVDQFTLTPSAHLPDGTVMEFHDRENPGGARVKVWVENGSARMSIDYPGAGSGLKGETGARRPVR